MAETSFRHVSPLIRGNEAQLSVAPTVHRVTVTYFRSISMAAGFRRHVVGKNSDKSLLV